LLQSRGINLPVFSADALPEAGKSSLFFENSPFFEEFLRFLSFSF